MTSVIPRLHGLGCVVFDLDDTLFLERDYVRSGFDAVGAELAELGVTGFGETAWEAFLQGVRGRIFDVALEQVGCPPSAELVARLVTVYRAHAPAITMLSDARACLDRLTGHVPLAVVTDGPIESQRAKAAALDVEAWAAIAVFTADLGDGFGKPHRRPFELVEEATGCSAERCVYLADNPAKDFGGPRSLGWRTVRVRRPASLHHTVDSGDDVDHEVIDLDGFGRR